MIEPKYPGDDDRSGWWVYLVLIIDAVLVAGVVYALWPEISAALAR